MFISNSASLPNFDQLWNYFDPAGTEQKFRAILPEAELSHDAEYHAQLLTQIARCQALQSNFDGSHATLDEVEKLMSANNLELTLVRYALERGRAFNSSGQPARAMPHFHSAYEMGVAQNQMRYAIDAVHMIAIAEQDPQDQIAWNLKGIALAEHHEAEKAWLHALLNNIGEAYLLAGDYQNAVASFHRLADIQRARSGEADMFTLKDEAKALRLSGEPARSLELMQPVLDKLLLSNADDGYIRQELAEALYALGRAEEARPHFAKGYELLSKDEWAMSSEPDKVARMKELSGV